MIFHAEFSTFRETLLLELPGHLYLEIRKELLELLREIYVGELRDWGHTRGNPAAEDIQEAGSHPGSAGQSS